MVLDWLLVAFVIVGVGFAFYEAVRPRRRVFRSLEEERSYHEQMGRMKAQEDYRNYKRGQQEAIKYPFGRSLFFDQPVTKKSKKQKNYFPF